MKSYIRLLPACAVVTLEGCVVQRRVFYLDEWMTLWLGTGLGVRHPIALKRYVATGTLGMKETNTTRPSSASANSGSEIASQDAETLSLKSQQIQLLV